MKRKFKTILILLFLFLSGVLSAQIQMPDTTNISIDDGVMYVVIADSIGAYTTYYYSDTVKIIMAISGIPTSEDNKHYEMGIWIEPGYMVSDGWRTEFLDKKKEVIEDDLVIWDYRRYNWK